MARRLDWEGAAKRDYVLRHGSTPSWVDLPKPKPAQTKTGARLKAKAQQRCAPILKQFERLSPDMRATSINTYRERINRACEEVRRGVPPSRARFASVVDGVEQSSLARLKKLCRNANKKKKKQSKQVARDGLQPSPLPVRNRRRRQRQATSLLIKQAETSDRRKREELRPVQVEAAVALGTVYASWSPDAEAERWKVLIRSPDGRARKATVLPGDVIATEVRGLRAELGPYELKVIGLGKEGPIAVGRVQGLDVGSEPTDSQAAAAG